MVHLGMSGGGGVLNVAGTVTVSNPGHVSAGLAMHVDAIFNYNGSAAQTIVLPGSSRLSR